MRVDYFRIETTEVATVVAAALTHVSGLANDASRTRDIVGVPFRMQELTHANRYWRGDILRIRMNDVPVVCSRDGELSEVDIEEDEGLGEETAFLYDTRTQVLAIQANRSGVSASKWARYLESLSDEDTAIIPVIVTEPNAAAAIAKLAQVRKVHVRYAGLTNAKLTMDHDGDTVEQIEALAETAPVMEVTFGMGRTRGSLPIQKAKAFLRRSFALAAEAITGHQGRVERIDVVGTFDDDGKADLNLLDYFMREQVDVPVNQASRRMVYADRQTGVDTAFRARREQLETMFPPRR